MVVHPSSMGFAKQIFDSLGVHLLQVIGSSVAFLVMCKLVMFRGSLSVGH